MVFFICPSKLVNYRDPHILEDKDCRKVALGERGGVRFASCRESQVHPPIPPHTKKDSSNFLYFFHKKVNIFLGVTLPGRVL